MPRLPADIRISLKKRGEPTHRIELVWQPVGRRYWVRRDGRYSTEGRETTASKIAERNATAWDGVSPSAPEAAVLHV